MTPKIQRLLDTLKKRCDAAGWTFDPVGRRDEWVGERGEPDWDYAVWPQLIPPGKDHGIPFDGRGQELSRIVESDFEFCTPLGRHEAIWSKKRNFIEGALVLSLNLVEHLDDKGGIQFKTALGTPAVQVRRASWDYLVWETTFPSVFRGNWAQENGAPWVIRIDDVQCANEDEADADLESWGNAALLALHSSRKLAGQLKPKDNRSWFDLRPRDARRSDTPIPVIQPISSPVPASLYLHVHTAQLDPCQKFLALYQVVEYFVPHFSKLKTFKNTMDKLRKDGSDVDEDALRALVDVTYKHRQDADGFRDTVKALLDQKQELQDLLSTDRVREFYERRPMPIHQDIIKVEPIDQTSKQVAKRLYQIRNRIVHGKEETQRPLFPFTDEARELWCDTLLMDLLARIALGLPPTVRKSLST